MRTLQLKKFKWIDVLNPTVKDMEFLRKNFDFHPLILKEIQSPTHQPMLEPYENYVFWIIHFPTKAEDGQVSDFEIDFLITKDTVITVRYREFDIFEKVFNRIKAHPEEYRLEIPGHLFYNIARQMLLYVFRKLEEYEDERELVEKRIFPQIDESIIAEMTKLKCNVISFLRMLKPQRFVWESARDRIVAAWGERFRPYMTDLLADHYRILHVIETEREVIDTLYISADVMLNNRRSSVMKILTIFTAIILPLSLVAGMYGMNLTHLPWADHYYTFWAMVGLSLVFSGTALIIFKAKKWL